MTENTQQTTSDIYTVVPITVKYPCYLLQLLDEIADSEFKNRSALLRELAVDYVLFRKNALKR